MAEGGHDLASLAEASGISYRTIWSYWHGMSEPNFHNLLSVRQALGCTWDELLGPCDGENDQMPTDGKKTAHRHPYTDERSI